MNSRGWPDGDNYKDYQRLTDKPCSVCLHNRYYNRHHVLPRSHGGTGTKTQKTCKSCHKLIHTLFTNAELAAMTWEMQRDAIRSKLDPSGVMAWNDPIKTARNPRKKPKKLCDIVGALNLDPKNAEMRALKKQMEDEIIASIMAKRVARNRDGEY